MNRLMYLAVVVGLVLPILGHAEDKPPEMPKPTEEHQWLQQLVGEWDSDSEVVMDPKKPPMKCKGTESARALGHFWVVAEIKSTMMDTPISAVFTLGYDPEKKKYVGTWVDSVHNHLWKYEGTVDATGKILTLETEGPNMSAPGKTSKYRESIEIKDKDHKVFTSSIQTDDGKWVTFVTANYRRKK